MDTAILHKISDYLRQTYRLTRTETQICEYLLRGNTRPDLRRLLDANEGKLYCLMAGIYLSGWVAPGARGGSGHAAR